MTWKLVGGLALLVVGSIAHPACTLSSRPTAAEWAAAEDAGRRADPDLAFTYVHVVDVERGRVLPEQTVLIAGNRIAAVGPTAGVHVPAAAKVVDARGHYLIPGLWDMHAHTVDDRITRETYLPLYLANGVTGIRNMHADCFDPCEDDRTTLAEVRRWQREIAAGQLVGPRMVAASDVIQGPPPGEPSSVERPATEAEARALVHRLKERGVDLLKTYDMLPRAAYFALADEARKQGIPFAGHVPTAVRASEASDAGQRSMEHLVGVFEECSVREDEFASPSRRAVRHAGLRRSGTCHGREFRWSEVRETLRALRAEPDLAGAESARLGNAGTDRRRPLAGSPASPLHADAGARVLGVAAAS